MASMTNPDHLPWPPRPTPDSCDCPVNLRVGGGTGAIDGSSFEEPRAPVLAELKRQGRSSSPDEQTSVTSSFAAAQTIKDAIVCVHMYNWHTNDRWFHNDPRGKAIVSAVLPAGGQSVRSRCSTRSSVTTGHAMQSRLGASSALATSC